MVTITREETTANRSAADKLRRISRTLATVFGVATLVLPLVIVGGVLFSNADGLRGALGFSWLGTDALTLERRMLLTFFALLLALPTLCAFDRLRALFVLYADGIVFTAANVACLRAAGKWLLCSGVAAIVAQPILSVAVSWGTKQQHLQIGLDSASLSTLLSGSVIYAIARVMELARAIEEERSQFI